MKLNARFRFFILFLFPPPLLRSFEIYEYTIYINSICKLRSLRRCRQDIVKFHLSTFATFIIAHVSFNFLVRQITAS